MMNAITNRMTKKDKHGRNHGGGYPKFKPSPAQRSAVRIMSGVKMTVDEMRKVILNPVTGLPLTRAAMYRYFRAEMDEGPPALKQLIAMHRWPFGGRTTCESCMSIDVRLWHRQGRLRAGQTFSWLWMANASRTAPSRCA
jgi:hypothetical protein